ncbi:iron complex outermembrane receptor protein [Algoriphagus iocasae]|uniref:Iron complex outermembrane receptor protein n=1 Tax=Algoriphagus iocasae TaxID=1836499 RepID=A0A841MJY3_9BACT|nr:TonB-dependent receptor [Algoriphagus iocasae]MBB6328612.1 iron complex outermembrane receptor protein [Algoriphagus iocasae]
MRGVFTCFSFVLFICINAFGQSNFELKGKITDISGEPLIGASIQVAGTSFGTITDLNGNYQLNFENTGDYQLKLSFIGFSSIQEKVTISKRSMVRNYQMEEETSNLQEVEIIGRKEEGYKNTSTFIGSKTQTNIKDLPQSVSYVTKELILDQGLMRVGETVKNFSGVSQFTFYDDITIRGFRINGGSNTQLVNGMRSTSGFWKQPLINYLERVEVLKGPSSALFGNASPGGVVNRVTKKPLDINRNSLSFSIGSFNNFRALADFTGPVNESKTLLYRLNLGYEDAQNFRDLQFDKNVVVAPSLSFIPSDKTRINLDLVFNNSSSRLDRGQSTFENDLYSTPITRSLNTANDYLKEQTYTITTSLNHQISKNISFNASYMKTGYNEDLTEHRSSNSYAVDGEGNNIGTMVGRQVFIRKRSRFVDNLSAYFNIQKSTGKFTHKLVVGYDYAQETLPAGGSQLTANGYRNASNTGSIAKYNPANKEAYLLDVNGNPVPNVTHFDLKNPIGSQTMQDMSKYFYAQRSYDPTLYHLNGFYVQDQITFGKLEAMIGLRYEVYTDFENYKKENEQKVNQNALLPRLGLVFKANENVNFYGTYVEGYNPQTASSISNPNAGGPFDPLISSMVEFGMKSDWFNKRLELTTGIYQIDQKNTLYQVPGETDLLQQIGKETAKGIEFDVTGRILMNWSVMASYAYNVAEITESPNEIDLGRQKPNAPKHQGNLWTKYEFDQGKISGLGIGLGANFVTERNLSLNDTQTIPGYAVSNAALYYTTGNVRLQININNLTDKTHWVGGYDYLRLFPGAPRNLLGTVTFNF